MQGTPRVQLKVKIAGFIGVLFLGFAAYIGFLYQQLETTFYRQDVLVPTRIYSDLTLLRPPMPRQQVLENLQTLHYSIEKSPTDANRWTFKLREIQYPLNLLPQEHPTAELGEKIIELRFDSNEPGAPLTEITSEGKSFQEIYLEPELVATLSHREEGVEETPEAKGQIRRYLKFEEFPSSVWKAIIAAEDQHFLDHPGLDPRGLARAFWINLKTLSLKQGGSTITQQLVKNLTARKGKNVFKKINELFLALILEARFEKEAILERYLNEVYLGQIGNLEIHGAAEGAKYFFNKSIDQLNTAEIALMAGLIRGPAYYSPYRYMDRASERQRWVLQKMVETGQIAEEEAKAAQQMPIRLAPPPVAANRAPYFTDFVKAELIRLMKDRLSEEEVASAGFRVYTTLNLRLNQMAQSSVEQGIQELNSRFGLSKESRLEGALAAADPSTGAILSLIGGANYKESNYNRILNMKRQVGSTFKPVVYMTAFRLGNDSQGLAYGPGYLMEDAPWTLTYDNGRQSWSPGNYDGEYSGRIPLRKALAHSINVVAAKLANQVGIPEVIQTARALGFTSDLPEVPALSLGVQEASPIEVLRAYSTVANHGVLDDLTVIRAITSQDGTLFAHFEYHPKQKIEASVADLVSDLLQSVFKEGTARSAPALGFDRPAAGKTGTTSDYKDAWFVGFTPEQIVSVVWVGPDKGELHTEETTPGKKPKKQIVKLTGASAALPIWIKFMNKALALTGVVPFPPSSALSEVRINPVNGLRIKPECLPEIGIPERYQSNHLPEFQATCSLPQ